MSWRDVWSRRERTLGDDVLQGLIELDGFDSGAGRIIAADWLAYVERIAERLQIEAGQSLYEIGCGAAALLYPLARRGVTVGGADYADNLLAHARQVIPDGHFEALEASRIDPEPRYDLVIANSVFHYFPDLAYAERVLDIMFAKSRGRVAVLELPDQAHRALAERIRRDLLSEEEYERKYRGFEHQYYDRDWFVEQGRRRGYACELTEQFIPNYAQNSYRFNCFFTPITDLTTPAAQPDRRVTVAE